MSKSKLTQRPFTPSTMFAKPPDCERCSKPIDTRWARNGFLHNECETKSAKTVAEFDALLDRELLS